MKTLKQLIKQNKLDYVNSDITEKNFPFDKKWKEPEYKLFHFGRNISSEDTITEMKKEGFEPATLQDLLNWKDWNGNDYIVALRQPWLDSDGGRYVSVLFLSDGGRRLDLFWFDYDWFVSFRFLGVRKYNFGTQSVVSFSHLDIKFEVDGKKYKVVEDK